MSGSAVKEVKRQQSSPDTTEPVIAELSGTNGSDSPPAKMMKLHTGAAVEYSGAGTGAVGGDKQNAQNGFPVSIINPYLKSI
jgi:hypothetical protein